MLMLIYALAILFGVALNSSDVDTEAYCMLRQDALEGSNNALQKISVIVVGDKKLKLSEHERSSEFALFSKMRLQKNGLTNDERFRIAFQLGTLEYGMLRGFPKMDLEARNCVDKAQSTDELNACLNHFNSWRNADVENPGPCPLEK